MRIFLVWISLLVLSGCQTVSESRHEKPVDPDKWCLTKNVNLQVCMIHSEMDHRECQRVIGSSRGTSYDYCRLHRVKLNRKRGWDLSSLVKCDHRHVGLIMLARSVCHVSGRIVGEETNLDMNRLVKCQIYSNYTKREKIVITSYSSCAREDGQVLDELSERN